MHSQEDIVKSIDTHVGELTAVRDLIDAVWTARALNINPRVIIAAEHVKSVCQELSHQLESMRARLPVDQNVTKEKWRAMARSLRSRDSTESDAIEINKIMSRVISAKVDLSTHIMTVHYDLTHDVSDTVKVNSMDLQDLREAVNKLNIQPPSGTIRPLS